MPAVVGDGKPLMLKCVVGPGVTVNDAVNVLTGIVVVLIFVALIVYVFAVSLVKLTEIVQLLGPTVTLPPFKVTVVAVLLTIPLH